MNQPSRRTKEHFSGCLLAGAAGDALGGPTEFMNIAEIRRRYGPDGQTGYVAFNQRGLAEFTDDTQMTLFTAEGLLESNQPTGLDRQLTAIWDAYQRWLMTQQTPPAVFPKQGLLAQPELWKRQAPGITCLSALQTGRPGTPGQPANNSKGCGGVMRVAPIGLRLPAGPAFELAARAAALTHGHPSGYLSAGMLAEIIAWLADGLTLEAAIAHALVTLRGWAGHEETLQAVEQACTLAANPHAPATPETVEKLGGGWIGEEALAISLYCALKGIQTGSLRQGVLLAVNQSGDNDSTGAITGNLLGMLMGKSSIPEMWLTRLELMSLVEDFAFQLLGPNF